jgi:hypothetical protein
MTQEFNRNVKWKVSLSNGETFYEGKGDYKLLKGELSPWDRLTKYLQGTKTEITSLSLYTDSGQNYHLPSSGNNPKFKGFVEIGKPINFTYFREAGLDLISSAPSRTTEVFAIISANYKDHSLQVWVSEKNPNNSWALVK